MKILKKLRLKRKNNLVILLCFFILQANAQKSVTSVFPLKWKQKIGVTTYRTNMVLDGDILYIGSNGEDRNLKVDPLDGVYALNAKTGEKIWHFQPELLGDNDVNGLAVDKENIYFGTDNYYFFCLDKKSGEQKWKIETRYDVESMPVMADLNGDGSKEVVFSVQGAGVHAVSAENGKLLWKQDSIGTSGNHAPLCVDLNNDGTKDVLIGGRTTPYTNRTAGFKMEHYGDYLFAFDGKNGTPLWQHPFGSNLHASPVAYRDQHDSLVICMVSAYCSLKFLRPNGEKRWSYSFGYGCFASPALSEKSISNSTSWHSRGGFSIYGKSNFKKEDVFSRSGGETGLVSASAAVADVSGDKGMEFISVDEDYRLLIVPESEKEKSYYLKLPKGAEATPYVLDVDGDGKNEILVACLDGYLYCYSTNRKGEVQWEGFRGGRKDGVY